MSAHACFTAWKDPTGWPNCSSFGYVRDRLIQHRSDDPEAIACDCSGGSVEKIAESVLRIHEFQYRIHVHAQMVCRDTCQRPSGIEHWLTDDINSVGISVRHDRDEFRGRRDRNKDEDLGIPSVRDESGGSLQEGIGVGGWPELEGDQGFSDCIIRTREYHRNPYVPSRNAPEKLISCVAWFDGLENPHTKDGGAEIGAGRGDVAHLREDKPSLLEADSGSAEIIGYFEAQPTGLGENRPLDGTPLTRLSQNVARHATKLFADLLEFSNREVVIG